MSIDEIDDLRHIDAAEALMRAKRLSRKENTLQVQAVLGSCYRSWGDIQTAKKILIKVLRQAPPRTIQKGDAAQRLAYVYLQEADGIQWAEKLCISAITLYSRLGHRDRLGQAYFDLATTQAFSDQYREAYENLHIALALLATDNFKNRFSAHLGLAHLHVQQSEFSEAIQEAEKARDLEERAKGVAHAVKTIEFMIRFEEKRENFSRAIELADDLVSRYLRANRRLNAPIATIWSARLRWRAGHSLDGVAMSRIFSPILFSLRDKRSHTLLMELIHSSMDGLLTLEQLEIGQRKLEAMLRKRRAH